MTTYKHMASLLLSLGLAISMGWYFTKTQTIVQLDDDSLSNTADTLVTGLTLKQFNPEGALVNQLRSPLMTHIPKGDIHWFDTPHMSITQDNQPAWDIRSLKAKSMDGGQSVTLMKHVIIHQNAGQNNQASTLKTEEIVYYPAVKKATTHLFVTFEQPGNIIQSTGMNAYLDEKRVELLHRAKGIYDPAKG